ncbi:SH2 domain-containing protein 5-like isoform X3 [Oncorhynchus keta]|uniref:SH2 domain-containing protein 5-like isoform X3 n=1 Tax=Oncorhynchus keta TaxID=8018 RepID=UPI00227D515D|nr:SH2 domain-containing protein 5-like isoform X3 [Oncorhynchus keta]
MGETPVREDGTVTRSAETCKKRRPVSLKFSIKGVKMYDEDETTLLMAHALRRVSLSTAHPSDAQFAFVSHNPGSPDAQLYCHLFKARHARAAQFLNLLLCRCFQLSYLAKHPEEVQDESVGPLPNRAPSLLNQGFPLCVSALVSFRRAPTLGLLPGEKVFPLKNNGTTTEEQPSSQEEVFNSSPSLVRKRAIRNKVLRSGAYRSFTYSPHKQRHLQDQLNSPEGKGQDKMPVRRARAPSLAETEEALAQAVWCWAGIATDSSSSLLAEDVLGSYLLCPHPKRTGCGSLIIRFSSGLVTHLIDNTSNGKYLLEDNDQKPTCSLCKGYIIKKESDGVLHQMTWPPQSPDLNPIEMMVWDELDRRVKEKQPTSTQHMHMQGWLGECQECAKLSSRQRAAT